MLFLYLKRVSTNKILQQLGPPKHQIDSENSYVPRLFHSKCEYLNTQVKVYVFCIGHFRIRGQSQVFAYVCC